MIVKLPPRKNDIGVDFARLPAGEKSGISKRDLLQFYSIVNRNKRVCYRETIFTH
jgi:hypothetical protein